MRHTTKLLWALLVALLASPGCAPTPQEHAPSHTESSVAALLQQLQPSATEVDGDTKETTTIHELMRVHHTPGVSIAVIRDGKIDWARGFGMADVETGRAVTTQTLFQAASISKTIAAAAALSMVQEGLLDLDEDVNRKLKSWQLPVNDFTRAQPVTLRQLLSHTAGTTVHGFPGYQRNAPLPSTIDILDGRGNTDPVRVNALPGSAWRYSGGGYTIVGQLMEDVAGKPFPQIVRERVLEPAGMTHSTFVQPLPLARESDEATAYAQDGSAIEGRYHAYPEAAAAGLWTTAEDLARFALAIQQAHAGKPGSLLSPRLVAEMLTPVMNQYGLGVGLSDTGNLFGHNGANAGFRSRMSASLDGGWGIVVLTNGDGGSALCELVPMAAAKAYGWPAFKPTIRKRVDIDEGANARTALFPNMGT